MSSPATDPVVVGIDGGGTGTRALAVAADGRIIGYGEAGPSNVNNRPAGESARAIVDAAQRALENVGEPPSSCLYFIGCAGVKSPGDGENLRATLAEHGVANCVITNDAETALAGGLAGAPGIVLVAGTGSFCLGRAGDRFVSCGGWGWLLDDVGSGFFLGREALRAAVQHADGRGIETSLLPAVLKHFGVADPDELLGAVYREVAHPARIAALAPLVLTAAAAQDQAAARILEEGAEGLAEMVAAVTERLGFQTPSITTAGGMTTAQGRYKDLVRRKIQTRLPAAEIVSPILPPVAGACLRGLEAVHGRADSDAAAKIRDGFPRYMRNTSSLTHA